MTSAIAAVNVFSSLIVRRAMLLQFIVSAFQSCSISARKRAESVLGLTLKAAILLAPLLLLHGCATTPVSEQCVFGTRAAATNARCQQLVYQRPVLLEHKDETKPRIGIALAGGGSKSAPFSLGVLSGLYSSGVLARSDFVSSVSGGSYAALYYFVRLMDMQMKVDNAPRSVDEIFSDCLPRNYKGLVYTELNTGTGTARPSGSSGTIKVCPAGSDSASVKEDTLLKNDPLRFSNHLRGYQDVLRDRDGLDFQATSEAKITGSIAYLLGETLLTLVPHNFANSIFDWRLDLSHSKGVYGRGITRAYARLPTACNRKNCPFWENGKTSGDAHSVSRYTLDNLRGVYEKGLASDCTLERRHRGECGMPLWIINATSGTSNVLRIMDTSGYRAEQNVFEFTPYGYGSGAFGYHLYGEREIESRPTLAETVNVSAAFFDSQQRGFGDVLAPVVNLGLHGLNLDWGTNIPNYNLTRKVFENARIWHSLLPWPFYLFYRYAATDDAVYIHLSDGGQSENLGVFALLRRGIKDIIVADAAGDEEMKFEDICELRRNLLALKESPLTLVVEGPEFSQFCEPMKNRRNELLHKWPAPVVRAFICPGDANTSSCDPGSEETTRLYLIKPALNKEERINGKPSLADVLQKADAECLGDAKLTSNCRQTYELLKKYKCSDNKGYPCEVVGFLIKKTEAITRFRSIRP